VIRIDLETGGSTGYVDGPSPCGHTYQIYSEWAGSGQDLLCMHTAGADGRQFHGLMADPRIIEHHRLVSFDLPWHGKSRPPEGAIHGSWRLNTDLYVDLIMGFIAAAGLHKPVVLGASMSGEICLELAYRHPDSFAGIIRSDGAPRLGQTATDQIGRPAGHYRRSSARLPGGIQVRTGLVGGAKRIRTAGPTSERHPTPNRTGRH
jgi:pimeloyl-ACP methyl ester carboxylesterase